MYLQRQGFCSLILEQHSLEGGTEDVIALTQELSCTGLHVTAIVISTVINITMILSAICDAFIFFLLRQLNFRGYQRKGTVAAEEKMS
ncbi:hypothetical protein Csa_013831 [Cucumis sativus]|nr:hypothetical protein Csa_013831 [Cucumis sativus]